MSHMGRVHLRGTVRSPNRTSVAVCIINVHPLIIEPVDFTAVIFEEIGYIIRAVILCGPFGERMPGIASCGEQRCNEY